MRSLLLVGVLAVSSSRAGCGTLANTISISEQSDKLAKEQEHVDTLSRELAAARAEIASQRAWAKAHSEWSSEQIRKLAERLMRLEQELAAVKKGQTQNP